MELLIVIGVIGLLLAYMGPRLVGRMLERTKIVVTRQKAEELKKALVGELLIVDGQPVMSGYRYDVGAWPPPAPGDTIGLTWLWRQPPGVPSYNYYTQHGWNGPYIRGDSSLSFLFDAWQNPFRFVRDANGVPIGIQSAGPDGVFGPVGTKDDDITVMF